jgi:hypothetical protein
LISEHAKGPSGGLNESETRIEAVNLDEIICDFIDVLVCSWRTRRAYYQSPIPEWRSRREASFLRQ